MNQRNVEALTSAMEGYDPHLGELDPRDVAIFLASRGILAVSALTDEEAWNVGLESEGALLSERPLVAVAVRRDLERAAKGEV